MNNLLPQEIVRILQQQREFEQFAKQQREFAQYMQLNRLVTQQREFEQFAKQQREFEQYMQLGRLVTQQREFDQLVKRQTEFSRLMTSYLDVSPPVPCARQPMDLDAEKKRAQFALLRDIERQALASRKPRTRIALPPGGWMLDIAGIVFSKKTREDVFEQAVQDFRDEYCEALSEDADSTRLFFLASRHWIGFVLAVLMQGGREIARVIKTLKGAG